MLKNLTELVLGLAMGYLGTQLAWVFWQLAKADPRFTLLVPQNKAPKGITVATGKTEADFIVQHAVEDGIERISYFPKKMRFETPILMQHGMFHGAWCWAEWQAFFAEWGWESHAISLPGHGKSPEQRPIRLCTLDYYLGFLRDEAKKLRRDPIIMGHSMGGALTQWYLKYINQPPAAVLLAPWVYHNTLMGAPKLLGQDPSVVWRMMLSWDASSWTRSPHRAAQKFISSAAKITPQELHAQLGPESALVLFQHNPPFWKPPEKITSPTFWLAGENDTVISVDSLRKSARHYAGDFAVIPGAGHDIMLEHNLRQSAKMVHDWLVSQVIE